MILPIQYLRGVAALLVVLHHAREQLPGLGSLVQWTFGTSGVDLFFVISGFIMMVTAQDSAMKPLQF
ncbi:MAG: acyltransferase family protein [Comamonadaceae bacterium]|nr:acyltransferase family protein [Comamonadaceae bacterium]